MTTKEDYINGLIWRLSSIKKDVVELQDDIQNLFAKLEIKQQQAQNILLLLNSEGHNNIDPELSSMANISIADIVYENLSNSVEKTPVHYIDLTKEILSKGILIPGKNPNANLLSHMNRDNRFVRTSPGTYGLKEWGLKAMQARKKKSRRKK